MPHSYSPVLTVDLGAVIENYRNLAGRLGPGRCGAVLKADAYGLGAAFVAPPLRRAGCEHFFVATVDEGLALRPMVPGCQIYLVNGLPPKAEGDIAAAGLTPILNSLEEIDRWRHFASRTGDIAAGLHIDTGLNRLGLPHGEVLRLVAEPRLLEGFPLALVLSHLACADDPEHPMNRAQLKRFRDLTTALKPPPRQGSHRRPLLSLSGSSGIFLGADYHFDLVRPGAALFGINPVIGTPNPLRQVVRLQAKILQLREVDLNMTVGYGASHLVRGASLIATLGIGYADGFFRSLGNRGMVFVAGRQAPIVERISMDLVTIDVGHLPPESCRPGMLVDIIGPGQTIDALAETAGTNGYEAMVRLGARFQRRYIGG
jgi:alanine racemase